MSLKNQDIKINQVVARKVVEEVAKITNVGGSFEVIKKSRYNVEYDAFKTLPVNLGAMYKTAAQTYGEADFIVYKDERHSFIGLYQQAIAFSLVLKNDFKIVAGDKVVIAMRNYPEWIIAFMGITQLGAVAVPLNAWWQEDEFMQVIEHSQALVVITDDKRFDLLSQRLFSKNIPAIIARPSEEQDSSLCMKKLMMPYLNSSDLVSTDSTFSAGLAQSNKIVSMFNQVAANDIATIFYTSGSTGVPKGAVSTHESILTAINTWIMLGTAAGIANRGIADEPEFPAAALMTVPLFHVTGCHTLFLLSMIAGRKTVMMPYWDAEEALKLIDQERITYFNGVPTMSMELMDHPNRGDYDLSSLNDVCAGGAARPPEHVRKIYDAFEKGNPSCGYGLTETNALGAVNGPADYIYKPNSAGLPTPPIVDLQIIDEQGVVLAEGEVGEIVIKTLANIIEYWREPELTKDAFIRGYFKTGDLGYLDDEGFVYIVDRAKDIIIRGGENISCLEVEAAIYKHDAVVETAVFAVPDHRLGEVSAAVVCVKDGSSTTQADLQAFVIQHLAKFKVPEHVWFVSEKLPRLGSGKINKKELKAHYVEQFV
jgi:acyl-CoA synthetase (AMP-forming)/AMP-acid ligase II